MRERGGRGAKREERRDERGGRGERVIAFAMYASRVCSRVR